MFTVSLDKVKPVVKKGWGSAKSYIMNTGAKRLVDNACVNTIESKVDSAMGKMTSKLEEIRDRQLSKEIPYLEKELQQAKKRLKVEEKQ